MDSSLWFHGLLSWNALRRAARVFAGKGSRRLMVAVCLAVAALGVAGTVSQAQTNEWTWRGGSSTPGNGGIIPGNYGSLGVPATGNIPGSRQLATNWTDKNGNLWLFGGYGDDGANYLGNLNDLWEFNSSTKEWAWMSGSSTLNGSWGQGGVYGTLGVASAANVPAGRYGAAGWTDSAGNLWLSGGWGCESLDTVGYPTSCYYNDLWKFDPATNEWTWMGGSNLADAAGVYGALGVEGNGNVPGARAYAVSWTDSTGDFWLFGGYGYDESGNLGLLNDLWKYDVSKGEWTWMGGSKTIAAGGVYGTPQMPAAGNVPGAREHASGWVDKQGNMWLFGGEGLDSANQFGYLNDLWKFNPSTDQWVWMGGSSAFAGYGGQPGVYEAWMTPAAGNYPGGRQSATSWTDGNGNLWLFGGFGYDSTRTYGYLDDLWEYNPSTNQWTWMGGDAVLGSALVAEPGVYGALQSPAFTNMPAGRENAAGWTDKNGNLWLFGGYAPEYYLGPESYQSQGYFNDLWEYQPQAGSQQATATPLLSLPSGAYPAGQTITISDGTPGAAIYYFVSGAAKATEYTGPIAISSTETIEALAVAPGYATSAVATTTYTVAITAMPSFSPAPGSYLTPQVVTITDDEPGSVIYYAINATPTTNSSTYSGPITVSSSETIEAIAVASGETSSATAAAAYTIWPASAQNQWAWMGGHSGNELLPGAYGVLGQPAPDNYPGGRYSASTWSDTNGGLWLFGGVGIDGNGVGFSFLNDMWRYDLSTRQWMWTNGSSTVGPFADCRMGGCGQRGIYGTLGTAAPGNTPGGREQAASWTGADGKLWLFGGRGYDSANDKVAPYLNDLWEFNPSTHQWTWMAGNSTVQAPCFGDTDIGIWCGGDPGVYGVRGTGAAGNLPGGREGSTSWVDHDGNLWLFGGFTVDATDEVYYVYNDLWEYNPSTKEWAWMGGASGWPLNDCLLNPNDYHPTCGQPGIYGTLQTQSAGSAPGSRSEATGWVDSGGDLWLFGGYGFDDLGNYGLLDDLWKFDPSAGKWTWMGGVGTVPGCLSNWNDDCPPGAIDPVFGTLGVPWAGTRPGFMWQSSGWKDNQGDFWLFAGSPDWSWGASQYLWEWTPSADEWAWMGPSSGNPSGFGVYGTSGAPSETNIPGARSKAASWTDSEGNFWLFGGDGYDTTMVNSLDDFWEYRPSAPAPVSSFAVWAVPASVAPLASVSLPAGTSVTTTIEVTVADGFHSPVTLAVGSLPSGVTASFNPATITGLGTSEMTISAALNTVTGNYSIPVNGTSGSTRESATVFLTVNTATPAFTLGASPSSLTVSSGGHGTVTLTVTPEYGFSSAVSFACSGLPAGASCAFNPATVTPAGSAASTTMTITAPTLGTSTRRNSWPFLPGSALAVGLCLFGWKRRRGLQLSLLVAVGLAGLGLISACGGGGSGSTPPTPAPTTVTSTITVTATSGSLQQITQVTLTVD